MTQPPPPTTVDQAGPESARQPGPTPQTPHPPQGVNATQFFPPPPGEQPTQSRPTSVPQGHQEVAQPLQQPAYYIPPLPVAPLQQTTPLAQEVAQPLQQPAYYIPPVPLAPLQQTTPLDPPASVCAPYQSQGATAQGKFSIMPG